MLMRGSRLAHDCSRWHGMATVTSLPAQDQGMEALGSQRREPDRAPARPRGNGDCRPLIRTDPALQHARPRNHQARLGRRQTEEPIHMRRLFLFASLAMLAAFTITGCGKKTEQASESSSADSLLAMNPTEQTPPGDLTPQESYDQQQQPPVEQPAAVTPSKPVTKPKPKSSSTTHNNSNPAPSAPASSSVDVPAGTAIAVTMNTAITSETAQIGDAWTGTVKEPLIIGTSAPIPAGSMVHGVVRGVKPAEKGDRALLVLAITSVEVNGQSQSLDATADSLIAGSTRARNVGAVAGGTAAGAILGKVIGGNKGAVIGGVLGGAGTAVGVSKTKGYQSTVKEGQDLTFKVDRTTRMRT